MSEQGAAQAVHFYTPSGMTFAERILCRTPDRGMNTHVTEYGTQVTCPACVAILRERERDA